MNQFSKTIMILSVAVLMTLMPSVARAEKIRDVITILGSENMRIEGKGLVTGLGGTGDTKDAAKKLLGTHLENNDYSLAQDDLTTKNLAFVQIDADIPPTARPGERINIRVSSINDASSLSGGILKITALRFSKNGPVILQTSGRVMVNANNPTTGVIVGGGTIVSNEFFGGDVVDDTNTFRLLLKRKSFSDAASISRTINSNPSTNPNLEAQVGFEEDQNVMRVARAVDEGMVQVTIPGGMLDKKVEYIAAVLNLDTPVSQPATVLFDRESGAAVITGEVRITPGFISYKGRTVTLAPQGQGPGDSYSLQNDTPRSLVDVQGPNQSGHQSLQNLVAALSAMQMNTDDLIVILQKLQAAGMLHANIKVE